MLFQIQTEGFDWLIDWLCLIKCDSTPNPYHTQPFSHLYYSLGRHSKSLDTNRKVCGYCHSPFELLVNSSSSRTPAANSIPKTPRTPGPFAMYVKEHYGTVKQQTPGIAHRDVMKQLGADFQRLKTQWKLWCILNLSCVVSMSVKTALENMINWLRRVIFDIAVTGCNSVSADQSNIVCRPL